jgi:hypothetical protein
MGPETARTLCRDIEYVGDGPAGADETLLITCFFRVELSLCCNWASCRADVWRSTDTAPHIRNLSSAWRYVVNFTRFPSRDRAPCTHSITGCVGSRAGLRSVAERIISTPARKRTPVVCPISSHCTGWDIPAIFSEDCKSLLERDRHFTVKLLQNVENYVQDCVVS